MTREEFVKRWRCHLAGMALFGVAGETRDGPLLRAKNVLDIPAEVERLLERMYQDLAKEEPARVLSPNGLPSQQKGSKT